jgi:hypothetical protein
MNNLLEWYRNAEEERFHPVVMSAIFHHKFTAIHPFDDGNGRLARILSNFILLKHKYPVIVIKNRDKVQYYAALNIADNGIYEDLIKLFAEHVRHSFGIIQKAINGENINEADDLDKEIELFVKESQINIAPILDFEKNKKEIIEYYIVNYFMYLLPKLNKIGELFQGSYLIYPPSKFLLSNYESFVKRYRNESIFVNNTLEVKLPIDFIDHIQKEFNFKLILKIIIKKKTIKYIAEHLNGVFDFIGNEEVDLIFNKTYTYDDKPDVIYNEVTANIINYTINFIKSKTNQD